MEQEETVTLEEEAMTEAINKEELMLVNAKVEAILMPLFLLVIWHSKLINKK